MTAALHAQEAKHPWVVRAVIIAAILVGGYFIREQIIGREFRLEVEPQRVSLLDEIPFEEPEPEEIEVIEQPEEELYESEPEEALDDSMDDMPPPLSDLLGLDGAGVAGSDAFGLLARRGGRDLLQSGDGDGCAWYETVLNTELAELLLPLLQQRESLLRRDYSVIVRLWLAPDGRVERYRMTSTGDTALDRELELAMDQFDRVTTPPPPELPQPVRVGLRCRTS